MTTAALCWHALHAIREQSEDQMDDRFRLGAAWALTFVVCGGLISAAYWNLHWGIVPFGN
jgi:hypothetical protein